jgi:hypothetical protein
MRIPQQLAHLRIGRWDAMRLYNMAILKSASKLVLLLVASAMIVGLFVGKISEETFKTAMLMVFTFYFANKGDSSKPYAGK